ncbi:fatty acyl-AMP ligase [Streptomyces montanisoli]|uniref:Fatty acyl-AMP ligase n=1 Tax=Streptomyces montanisoli TaxID=2798581 RepID=A0A940MKH5_9ACTN|nr:fatty acyl-AMP ligase [Streptomyces montanisoli]MBP0461831.1 fatty acyl-AMP ligase [Streptomyces montanisoli]
MTPSRSFTEALAGRFSERADHIALCVPDAGGAGADLMTYRELALRARRLARRLGLGATGGRPVLVCMDTGPHLAVAVVGCLLAGAVVSVVPPPASSRAARERMKAITEDTGTSLVLTEAALAADVSRYLAEDDRGGYGGVLCLAVDAPAPGGGADGSDGAYGSDGADADGAHAQQQPPSGDSPALIQYTSGTTAAPRGVVVTHANLLAAMESIRAALSTDQGSRIGGWLPLHHDLGLIGQLLHPLWLGATAVLVPPARFAARPLRWLETLDRYGVTATAAPDTAFARCAAEATDEDVAGLDLSRLRTAVDAAEQVSPGTLADFARRFAPAGLRPGALVAGYGLAEATLMVSVATPADAGGPVLEVTGAGEGAGGRGTLRPRRQEPGADTAVPAPYPVASCGPARGVEVRVVDPDTREELPDREIGEIWVRGDAVSPGYWHRALENAETFGRATASGAGGFLRTGDLGALDDGRLYVTGRIKDVLTVAGRTLHPQEVEHQLRRCGSRFASAAVFMVRPRGGEHLVAVQEVRTSGGGNGELAGLAERVRRCLAEDFGATGSVLLVRPGTVRRTTSGKVRRSVMRELFLRGELRPLHTEPAAGSGAAAAGPPVRKG